jgi:Na+/proline symporter
MNILTFGDFYRIKFNRNTEIISSFFMIASYFGWIAAQLVALGIILNVISGFPILYVIVLSAIMVATYTFLGGLWAISVTDFMQTIIIIIGLTILAISLVIQAGGFQEVISQAPEGYFKFLPDPNLKDITYYFAAWITIGLGAIPQQDVFQRVMSAKSEIVAVRSSYIASGMYLSIAFLPLLIGLCSMILFPELLSQDEQVILPTVVLLHTNLGVQVLFFGALLSAIMSTTSAAILAPASILAENLIKPLLGEKIKPKNHLLLLRISVLIIATLSTILATYSSKYLSSCRRIFCIKPSIFIYTYDCRIILEESNQHRSYCFYDIWFRNLATF